MALEQVFSRAFELRRRRNNPFYILLDGYCQWMLDHGFVRTSICTKFAHLRFLTDYLIRIGVHDPTELRWDHIERFRSKWLPRYRGSEGGRSAQARVIGYSVSAFSRYLASRGLISPPPPAPLPYQSLLDQYLGWLTDHLHRSPRTVEKRRLYVIPLLDSIGADDRHPGRLSAITPRLLQDFLMERGGEPGSAKAVEVACSLRRFLTFCVERGHLDRDLSTAIPSFRRYKLSAAPRGINDEDAQRLLQSIDRRRAVGLRDYAIVQLLYTYGVRGEQVSTLRLDDIQWAAGQIRFPPIKCGKTVINPLTDEVGDSLLAYLRQGRPSSPHPEVFLISTAPFTPINRTLVPWIVCNRIRKAGLKVPVPGARAFRHRFATQMLADGHGLKSIADMLGHRNLESTSIYAKVDFHMLEEATLSWPEDRS
jgi:site-specific recombinase XerD